MKKKENQYHHGNLRAALIDTTAGIIASEGVEAVSMRTLAEKTGVSRTAPYRHFEDKSALLAAVAEQGFEELHSALKESAESRMGSLKRFEKMALAYLDFALKNPAYYRLMFGKELASESPPEALMSSAMTTLEAAVSVIAACQKDGHFRKADTVALANTAWSTLHGMSSLLLDGQIRTESRKKITFTLESKSKEADGLRRLAKTAVKVLTQGMK